MTLGQFLTAKSPLPTGTVAQHLAAIAASVGTGTGETVFASRFSVVLSEDRVDVTRHIKRAAPEAAKATPKVQQRVGKKDAVAVTYAACAFVSSQSDELVATSHQKTVTATRSLGEVVVRKKGKLQ